jgi:membrane protease YdiL (CAAX protease family)
VADFKVQRRNEILLVLGVSLGQSAVYSLVNLIAKLTEKKPLAEQAARLNTSLAPGRPWLDLTYQLLGIFFSLVPAMLAWHFLNRGPGRAPGLLGIDRRRPGFDLGLGALLAAAIGLPGLGLYFAARELGINATVIPAGLPDVWWAVPVLVLAAVQNAVLEEVVVVGYLVTRLRAVWTVPVVVAASALLRGAYHLYQGFGGFIGNAVMGVVFALVFLKWRRLTPLIVAHSLLDIVAFVGYAVATRYLHWTP